MLTAQGLLPITHPNPARVVTAAAALIQMIWYLYLVPTTYLEQSGARVQMHTSQVQESTHRMSGKSTDLETILDE